MVHEHAEALGALVRPAAFKAVESWCKPTLVGSIPMRFRSTIGPCRRPLVTVQDTRESERICPTHKRGEGKT
jgi:hypothetical protein